MGVVNQWPVFWTRSWSEGATHLNLSVKNWHLLRLKRMPRIQVPTPLRQYAGKQAAIDVPGATVGEALNSLISTHPELRRHLYTDEGKLRAFVNVYLNDEDVRYLEKEATPLV